MSFLIRLDKNLYRSCKKSAVKYCCSCLVACKISDPVSLFSETLSIFMVIAHIYPRYWLASEWNYFFSQHLCLALLRHNNDIKSRYL